MTPSEPQHVNATQFLRQYENLGTRRSYRTALVQFFEMIYPEMKRELEVKFRELKQQDNSLRQIPTEYIFTALDEYSDKYLSEDRDYREDLMNLRDHVKTLAPKTKTNRITTMRAFFTDNNIDLPKRLYRNLINGGANQVTTWQRIPTNDELRRICEYLLPQGKALALILSSSGMRIGEAMKLKVSDLDVEKDPVEIKIRGVSNRRKNHRRITFMSPEAKDALDEWLKYRDQYLEQASTRTNEQYRKKHHDNIFPFTAGNFNEMWNNALDKAGLLEIDKQTNRVTMRPHNLRKFFRIRVGKFSQDASEALIGHQSGLNKVYANFNNEDGKRRLRDAYVKAIPDLSIYGKTSVITDEHVKEEMKKNEDAINELIKDGYVKDKKIKWLTAEIEKLNENVKVVKEQLTNTENAFNLTVDKLIHQIENLERTLEDLTRPPEKNKLFEHLQQ